MTAPRIAVSMGVVVLLYLQFFCVRRLIEQVSQSEAAATLIATIVTWAIYPLTDLYNRAAIPEFIAITLLQSGVCLWLCFVNQPGQSGGTRLAHTAGFVLMLAAGTHLRRR